MAVNVFPIKGPQPLQQYEQLFTSSGTWTRPEGVKTVEATIVAGSGGASGTDRVSGAGGLVKTITSVEGQTSLPVVVGAAGTTTTAGGASSFGSIIAFGSESPASGGIATNQGGSTVDANVPTSFSQSTYTAVSNISTLSVSTHRQIRIANGLAFLFEFTGSQNFTVTNTGIVQVISGLNTSSPTISTPTLNASTSFVNFAGNAWDVLFLNGLYVLYYPSSTIFFTSTNGINWTLRDINNKQIRTITVVDGSFWVFYGDSATDQVIASTLDFSTFSVTRNVPNDTYNYERGMVMNPSGFTVIRTSAGNVNNSRFRMSTDFGATWQTSVTASVRSGWGPGIMGGRSGIIIHDDNNMSYIPLSYSGTGSSSESTHVVRLTRSGNSLSSTSVLGGFTNYSSSYGVNFDTAVAQDGNGRLFIQNIQRGQARFYSLESGFSDFVIDASPARHGLFFEPSTNTMVKSRGPNLTGAALAPQIFGNSALTGLAQASPGAGGPPVAAVNTGGSILHISAGPPRDGFASGAVRSVTSNSPSFGSGVCNAGGAQGAVLLRWWA